jgi:hypothetical protein
MAGLLRSFSRPPASPALVATRAPAVGTATGRSLTLAGERVEARSLSALVTFGLRSWPHRACALASRCLDGQRVPGALAPMTWRARERGSGLGPATWRGFGTSIGHVARLAVTLGKGIDDRRPVAFHVPSEGDSTLRGRAHDGGPLGARDARGQHAVAAASAPSMAEAQRAKPAHRHIERRSPARPRKARGSPLGWGSRRD